MSYNRFMMFFTKNDFSKQVQERVVSLDQLKKYIDITDDTKKAFEKTGSLFKWGTTPYYASLMDKSDNLCPVRLQTLPSIDEASDETSCSSYDPLLECENSPTDNIVQVYKDRVAFCISDSCASFCRFCFRKYYFKKRKSAAETIDSGIDYIRRNKEIRDVLLTGGDPFMLDDDQLESILRRLREIKHVEIIRIGTRLLCTLPQRFNEDLAAMLEKYHPIYVNVQFNHEKEITDEVMTAAATLLKAGIPLQNQSVLLRGVNDSVEALKKLNEKLLTARIIPYYLFQCQLISGGAHFRVPIEEGINIMKKLRGYTTGFAIPQYILDTPYGKVPLSHNRFIKRDGDYVHLETFSGKTWAEYNPAT
ncbi:KamA family radical SAM protein [Thermodesulfobacteriota bacterium]